MSKLTIDKSVVIRSARFKSVASVYYSGVTRQLGGEYVSDWQVGGSFGFKGLDGTIYTRGSILEIEPEKLLKHDLYEGNASSTVSSTITYKFTEQDGKQGLICPGNFSSPLSDAEYAEADEGWDAALAQLK